MTRPVIVGQRQQQQGASYQKTVKWASWGINLKMSVSHCHAVYPFYSFLCQEYCSDILRLKKESIMSRERVSAYMEALSLIIPYVESVIMDVVLLP